MTRLTHRAAAVAALLITSVLAAGPAFADDPSPDTSQGPSGFACLDQKAGYEAAGVCQLTAQVQAICVNDAPYLHYHLDAEGTPNTTATLVWGDENGKNVTMSGMPLDSQVLWPGATVDAQGNATDWPGWTLLPDGTWQQGDEWNWVRDTVPLTFHVNPTTQVVAEYPAASMPCANPPSTAVLAEGDSDGGAVLAATGANALSLGLVAAVFVGLGGVLLVVRHRGRRRTAER